MAASPRLWQPGAIAPIRKKAKYGTRPVHLVGCRRLGTRKPSKGAVARAGQASTNRGQASRGGRGAQRKRMPGVAGFQTSTC